MSVALNEPIRHQKAKIRLAWNRKQIDVAFIIVLSLVSILYQLGRVQTYYPLVILGGDAANIASWAAAWDHPELFTADGVLSNTNNFRFYQTIHIPLTRLIASTNGGNYGLAFVSLLGLHIFVYGLGFYILGRVLLKNRYWALLFTIVNMGTLNLNLGEYWGPYLDPQPRFTFQALLPFVLALAVIWRSRPARWPWLMILAGLLMYVHPVSAPLWAFALWLGLWPFHPSSWSLQKRFGIMLGMGIIFLVICVPFLANYSQDRLPASQQDYSAVYAVIQASYRREAWDTPYGVFHFIRITTQELLLPLSVIGAAIVWRFTRKDRSTFILILMWLVGIGIISVLIPFVEQNIERALHILPLQIDLFRGLRYTVPFMLLFCIWPLAAMSKNITQSQVPRIAAICLGVVLTGLWIYKHPPYTYLLTRASSCFETGNLVCPSNTPVTLELLNAVRELTPADATFMPAFGENTDLLMLRYAALRSIVFTQKDRAILGYNMSGPEMLEWNALYNRISSIAQTEDPVSRLRGLLDFSRELGAQYLITINSQTDPMLFPSFNLDVIFSNETYSLIRL